MLIFSDLSVDLIIKSHLMKKFASLIFKDINFIYLAINSNKRVIRDFGLHKFIFVLH